jgi:Esterase/lipase
MTLNPQVSAFLGMFEQFPPSGYASISVERYRELHSVPLQIGPPLEVERVEDLTIPLEGRSLGARLYVPPEAGASPPVTLFYHGGGWVICSLDTHDSTCRALARASGSAVLSVDYRLAPETPFPGPLDDCYEALRWARANASSLGVDGERIAVAGDSAGGNLAAAVAIRARDGGGPPLRHQLLLYPVTDADFETGSYSENGNGDYLLSTEAMRWFWGHYVGDTANPDPLAAILRHGDLSGLPPATLQVAQYDPLRDEGLAYAEALKAAVVPVEVEVAPGMIHGYFSLFEAIPDAQPYIDRAGARLKEALA